ncbi:ABC transporter ATP-binding protein [Ruminococcus sp. Marseille-P6503]|uniref:ABC transporter ATP-binding protein n=1 Tax=Ruminococcus sp. Marseille-P6503 TaxID=2364796 RepID=UPI000F547668|nr:ABC transporter ATP-binding protein [Ruminococcus sp. Marseille-P6503]
MIKLENITKIYNQGSRAAVNALNGIDLEVSDGELLSVIGRSGSGKSTLLNIIGCIDTPTEGRYFLDGEEISKLSSSKVSRILNRKIGFVLQDFGLMLDRTVYQNLSYPLIFNSSLKQSEFRQRIMKALELAGLPLHGNPKCGELSGGQKQRVAIARAIINEPSVILADEPTGALDSKTSEEIMKLFKTLNDEGRTVIIVTHDRNVAAQCNKIIEISDGRII